MSADIEAQIAADRYEASVRQHAGMRFERPDGRFEDARGEIVDVFAEDVEWPARVTADLTRWGYGAEPSWVERNLAETAAFRAKWGI